MHEISLKNTYLPTLETRLSNRSSQRNFLGKAKNFSIEEAKKICTEKIK